jgi:hypothetical protein
MTNESDDGQRMLFVGQALAWGPLQLPGRFSLSNLRLSSHSGWASETPRFDVLMMSESLFVNRTPGVGDQVGRGLVAAFSQLAVTSAATSWDEIVVPASSADGAVFVVVSHAAFATMSAAAPPPPGSRITVSWDGVRWRGGDLANRIVYPPGCARRTVHSGAFQALRYGPFENAEFGVAARATVVSTTNVAEFDAFIGDAASAAHYLRTGAHANDSDPLRIVVPCENGEICTTAFNETVPLYFVLGAKSPGSVTYDYQLNDESLVEMCDESSETEEDDTTTSTTIAVSVESIADRDSGSFSDVVIAASVVVPAMCCVICVAAFLFARKRMKGAMRADDVTHNLTTTTTTTSQLQDASPSGNVSAASAESTEHRRHRRRRHTSAASAASAGSNSYNFSTVVVPGGASVEVTDSRRKKTVVVKASPKSRGKSQKYVIAKEDLRRFELIGKGSFGNVYRGEWRHATVAIKDVREVEALPDLLREAEGLKALQPHCNVIEFYGVVADGDTFSVITAFASRGALSNLLYGRQRVQFTDDELRGIALGAAAGVRHLHAENVIHRDLAARNILIDEAGVAKIADFGMSRNINVDEDDYNTTTTAIGPFRWMSPEQMTRRSYSRASDVWSFGVVLFEIFALAPPWAGVLPFVVVSKVIAGETLAVPTAVDERLRTLMFSCWRFEPKERPTMVEVHTSLSQL